MKDSLLYTLSALFIACAPIVWAEDGVSSHSQLFEGKSLEQLVNMRGINKDSNSLNRKIIAQDRFSDTLDNPNYPDIQIQREFLVRENLGAPVDPQYFVVNASEPFRNIDAWSSESPQNKAVVEIWKEKSFKIGGTGDRLMMSGEDFQTRDPGNTENLYRNFSFLSVDFPGRLGSTSEGDLERRRSEASECLGQQIIMKRFGDAKREAVMKCFEFFDHKLYAKMGYHDKDGLRLYRALDYVTSIVDENNRHHCTASVYKKNIWITAAHCIAKKHIESGIYILSNNSRIKIEKTNSKACSRSQCDIGTVSAPTPEIYFNVSISSENTKNLLLETPMLIPGIEQGTPIIGNDSNAIKNSLMWSHVGKGYCNAYKTENGCISHTCSSLNGFSGAPVYIEDSSSEIRLVGIHSGNEVAKVSCKTTGTNYATSAHFFNEDFEVGHVVARIRNNPDLDIQAKPCISCEEVNKINKQWIPIRKRFDGTREIREIREVR